MADSTNFLKGAPAIGEVQSSKNQAGVPLLVTPDPALSNDIPFRLEVAAKLTAKPCFKRSEQNSNCVITGSRRQSLIGRIIEFQRWIGEEFLVELFEFFGCLGFRSCTKQRQKTENDREAQFHLEEQFADT